MYYKIWETTYKTPSERSYHRDRRHRVLEELFGVCTCGKKFLIKKDIPEKSGTNRLKTVYHREYTHCPKCGDPMGNDHIFHSSFWMEGGEDVGDDFSRTGCLLYSFVDTPEGGVTVLKEIMPKESANCRTPSFTRYEVAMSPIPVPHVESIKIDGHEVRATKSNVAKALSGVSIPVKDRNSSGLSDTLKWVENIFNTSSLAKAAGLLFDYPVLDSVFHESGKQRFTVGASIASFIQEGEVKKGERSARKALGLPKAVCRICYGKASLKTIKWAVREFGSELTATAIKDIEKLYGAGRYSDEMFAEFIELYCGELKTAERQRVMQYLTHDVAVYQGIEDPQAAFSILMDYRKMCKDMEISPELCPKSLKLQHDMAARNHRLCLNEIQKRKFIQAVERPEYKRLAWTSADKAWTILVPENPEDLIEEGRKQSHCVGSYVSYISEGTYRICFMRRTKDLNKSVLTLTVDNRDCCIFYKGFDNREATAEEKTVLKEWAKEKKLSLSSFG